MSLLTLPVLAQFQSYTNNAGIWTYDTDDGTITDYTGPGGAVIIPSEINGLPVTSIGGYYDSAGHWFGAFYHCTSLTGVTIPDSITSIGDGVFDGCTGLTNITIPGNVTDLGDDAFSECSNLTSVVIGNSVTSIGQGAFYHCISLTNITIPDSVASIGRSAFEASGLTSITIPNNVTSIGAWAFFECINLASVTIGTNVTSIGDDAFIACSRLTKITIPDSVTGIGIEAFNYCTNLAAFAVDVLNPVYSSVGGVLFNKSRTTLVDYPVGLAGSYTIPNGVTNIGDEAFASCGNLTGVTIPDSVTSIGDSAFIGCTNLPSVTIPGSVANIGDYAFCDCTSLSGVYFGGNAPSPSTDSSVFADDYPTVYYLPGTTGWGADFDGRPAVLWNPQVQPGSFGVRTNQFGFNITGSSNLVVLIEASTSLVNPTWSPLQTNTLNGNSLYFTDPQWTNYSSRFYRVTWP
jgi:hypothetical protein